MTPDSPTPAEALEIFNGYIAYYGTYTVDDVNITVQVEGAWDPSQVGTNQAIRTNRRYLDHRRPDNLHQNVGAS